MTKSQSQPRVLASGQGAVLMAFFDKFPGASPRLTTPNVELVNLNAGSIVLKELRANWEYNQKKHDVKLPLFILLGPQEKTLALSQAVIGALLDISVATWMSGFLEAPETLAQFHFDLITPHGEMSFETDLILWMDRQKNELHFLDVPSPPK